MKCSISDIIFLLVRRRKWDPTTIEERCVNSCFPVHLYLRPVPQRSGLPFDEAAKTINPFEESLEFFIEKAFPHTAICASLVVALGC